ncbi:STM4011 family radical SAM protein [Phycisphaeraceae bacterium D3-23]
MTLSILYRGELSGCNYGCPYCPFAKRVDRPEHLTKDRAQVERFVDWAQRQADRQLGVFFTPWGEALVRPWYQEALARLSRMPHVVSAAIQTNLSCTLRWLERCDLSALGLWCTYHPGEVSRDTFLKQCRALDAAGARYSVGVVGLREHFDEVRALRAGLEDSVYLWVNAYKREPGYYSDADVDLLAEIDPLFELNNRYYPTRGRACHAGHSAVSVDGEGTVRRCHFIKAPIANIYERGWAKALESRGCTNNQCGCHIGYVHLEALELDTVYGQGLLDRIPERPLSRGETRDRIERFYAGNRGAPVGVSLTLQGEVIAPQ